MNLEYLVSRDITLFRFKVTKEFRSSLSAGVEKGVTTDVVVFLKLIPQICREAVVRRAQVRKVCVATLAGWGNLVRA